MQRGGGSGVAGSCGRGSTAGWWGIVVEVEVAQARLQQAVEVAVVAVAGVVAEEAAAVVENAVVEANLRL